NVRYRIHPNLQAQSSLPACGRRRGRAETGAFVPESLLRMVDISVATPKRAAAARSRGSVKNGKKRRGGRLTETRQREIVALVAPLFIERGYERVTIDDIVAVIGGSKRTLYERFGGKAGLFEIVIGEYCASVQRDLF